MKGNMFYVFFNIFLVCTFLLGLYVTVYFDQQPASLGKKGNPVEYGRFVSEFTGATRKHTDVI